MKAYCVLKKPFVRKADLWVSTHQKLTLKKTGPTRPTIPKCLKSTLLTNRTMLSLLITTRKSNTSRLNQTKARQKTKLKMNVKVIPLKSTHKSSTSKSKSSHKSFVFHGVKVQSHQNCDPSVLMVTPHIHHREDTMRTACLLPATLVSQNCVVAVVVVVELQSRKRRINNPAESVLVRHKVKTV